MSEKTDKWPEPQNGAGEVLPPAAPGGRVKSSSAADQHPVQKAQGTAQAGGLSKDEWIELHEELPRPTYWPITMAVAITLIAFGIVNALLIIIIGIILLIVSLIGWIGDVRDEARLRKH